MDFSTCMGGEGVSRTMTTGFTGCRRWIGRVKRATAPPADKGPVVLRRRTCGVLGDRCTCTGMRATGAAPFFFRLVEVAGSMLSSKMGKTMSPDGEKRGQLVNGYTWTVADTSSKR